MFPFFFFYTTGGGCSRGMTLLLVPFSIFEFRHCIFLFAVDFMVFPYASGPIGVESIQRLFGDPVLVVQRIERLICGESSPANVSLQVWACLDTVWRCVVVSYLFLDPFARVEFMNVSQEKRKRLFVHLFYLAEGYFSLGSKYSRTCRKDSVIK
jgi:hypothetical protein